MDIDVSFFLPTNRDPYYATQTINSINKIDSKYNYEICLYSRERIVLPNVRWYEEREQSGPIAAFNNMAADAEATYFICLVDDHIVEDNIFNVIDFLQSDEFKERQFTIATISPGESNFAHIPVKGDTWCGGILVDYVQAPHTTMRFPAVSKQTVKKQLQNFIFHPAFKYHAGDLWLGYYLGEMGEPGIQYEGANITEYQNLRNWQYEKSDCQMYHRLVSKFKQGQIDYVVSM